MVGRAAHHATVRSTLFLSAKVILSLKPLCPETNPVQPVFVTVGSIHGGSRPNIIPDEVALQLSVRTFTHEVPRSYSSRAIRRIVLNEAERPAGDSSAAD